MDRRNYVLNRSQNRHWNSALYPTSRWLLALISCRHSTLFVCLCVYSGWVHSLLRGVTILSWFTVHCTVHYSFWTCLAAIWHYFTHHYISRCDLLPSYFGRLILLDITKQTIIIVISQARDQLKQRTASRRYWGICVVLPQPVSPSMISTWWLAIADNKSSLNGKIGRLRRVSSIDILCLCDADMSFYTQSIHKQR